MYTGHAAPACRIPSRPRHRSRAALAAGVALLAAAAGHLLPRTVWAEASGARALEMPAFRRVLLMPDESPAALGAGVLRKLARDEFEEKVRRARDAVAGVRRPPCLSEARYRARLVDNSLVGDAQWKIVHTGTGRGLLPLQPFNVAIRKPLLDRVDALIAEFDGQTPSLLVESPGEHSLDFEWSARGDERPDELVFDLRLPDCAVAVLELELPTDRVAIASDGSLVSGPYAAAEPDRRSWRVACGGRSGAEIRVRRAGSAARPTLLVARQYTTQILEPEGLEAVYQIDLELLHREVTDLLLEFDPDLRPYEVTLPGIDRWQVHPPEKAGAPALLAIHLSEPLRAGRETLTVRCLAPVGDPPTSSEPAPLDWRSPAMRVAGAIPRGETLVLLVSADLRIDRLKPGDFQLTANTSDPASTRRGPAQRFTFVGGAVGGREAMPRRPFLRLQPFAVEYRARQLAWWQPGAEPPSLTLEIIYDVERGRLFQLPVLLPAGWDVERVDVSPAGLLRNWTLRPASPDGSTMEPSGGEGRQRLVVELQRPVTPVARGRSEGPFSGVSALLGRLRAPTLTLRLVPKTPLPPMGGEFPFPDAMPLGARLREGVFAVGLDSQVYQATLNGPSSTADLEDEGPWGRQVPDAVYQYRGRPIEGTLVLSPRPAQVRARCISDVYLPAGRAAVNTRLILEAESGRPNSVEVALSAPANEPPGAARMPDESAREWRVEQGDNTVRSFQRSYAGESAETVAALAATNPLATATLLAARPTSERWRLTFAHPLRAREPLILHSARPLERQGQRWDVPLPSAIGVKHMDGEVTLHLAGAEYVLVETTGLQEAPASQPVPGRPKVGTPWRTFRYGEGPVSLSLGGRGASVDRTTEALADQACLTTYAGDDGGARHYFTFRVFNWAQHTLPVQLPAGARLVAVQVGGRAVDLQGAAAPNEPGAFDLPVPRAAGGAAVESPLRFEIVYDTRATSAAWLPWTTYEAPAPVLPVAASTFRRTWRLPPGSDPIPDGRLQRVPGQGGVLGEIIPHGISERFVLSDDLSALAKSPAAGSDQAEGLAAAAFGLRPKVGGRVVRLREMIAEMAKNFLVGRLVVDDDALRDAGISDETLIAIEPADGSRDQSAPWETAGLTAVSAGPAVLLTTTSRADLWRKRDDPPDSVHTAVARAIANGHDETGHFRAASDWIRHKADAGRPADAERLPDLGPALAPWTEWEPVAGAGDDAKLVAVRQSRVVAGAAVAVGIFLLGLWRIRARAAWLWSWLTLAGIATLWLPLALRPLGWLPLGAAAVVALVAYVIVGWRRSLSDPTASAGMRALAATSAVVVCVALPRSAGTAESPAAVAVYISPESSGLTVLAPEDLLERLDALGRAGAPGDGAFLVSASYEGKVVAGVAEFQAKCEAYCVGAGPASLTMPLDGAYLEGAIQLDGTRTLPVSVPAPAGAVSVPVQGAGRHRLEFRFRTPVTEEDGGHGVRFALPRLLQNQVRLQLPAGASGPASSINSGAQHVTDDAGRVVLEADPGRVATPLQFRWWDAARPATTSVREAYLWDIQPDSAKLTALLDYHVTAGAVSTLGVDLPIGLEVQTAGARRFEGSDGVRLRDWHIATSGTARTLEMELASPAAGVFQVFLTLVPAAPLAGELTLPLPGPRAAVGAEPGHLAYRVRGVTAELAGTRWLTGAPPEGFAPFWPAATRPDLRGVAGSTSVYAATFRRESGQTPQLSLRLSPSPASLRVQHQELKVRLFPRHGELDASLRIATPETSPAEIALRLRPSTMTVASVRGERVRRWSQSGDRLLVWVQGESDNGQQEPIALEVAGWLPCDEAGDRLQIPSVRVEGAEQEERARVRFLMEPGLTLTPGTLNGLHAVAAPEGEMSFVADRPDYNGVCDVRAGAAGTAVKVLTVVRARDGRLAFESAVDFRVPKGELRSVAVRLRNWEGGDVTLTTDKAVPQRQRERRRAANDRTWALELRPGVTGRLRLTLSGDMSLEGAAASVPMPEVTAPGASSSETLLFLAGTDLSADGGDGLTATDWSSPAVRDWSAESARWRLAGGQLWKVARDDWSLRLRPRPGPDAGPVRLIHTDHSVALADGQHWLHEAVYWVRHGPNTDLNLVLCQPGTVVAVAVDGIDVAPLQPEPHRLWLPLPGRAGVRAVRVRWRYDPSAESLEHPLLQTPGIEGAVAGPGVWTVFVPAGFEALRGDAPALRPGRARAAAVALSRADGQLRVCAALVEAARDGTLPALATAQQRFYSACRQAEEALQFADDANAETGPGGETLAEWERSLLDEDRRLAKEFKFEETRAEAERRADTTGSAWRTVPEEIDPGVLTGLGSARIRGPLPDNGTPAYLVSSDSIVVPALTIRPRRDQHVRRAIARTAALAALLFLGGTLALSPGLQRRLLPFWPEPLLVFGLLAYYLRGPTPAAALLIVLGVGCRVLVLAEGVRHRLWRRSPAPAVAGAGSSSRH
jgi:hypothetical protein